MAAIFTVDWEDFHHAVDEPMGGHTSLRATDFILDLLDKHKVKAVFYCLGIDVDCEPEMVRDMESRGHVIGSHGWHHGHNEVVNDSWDKECRDLLRIILHKEDNEDFPYRSPYWDTTPMPWPPGGGFFFRSMPFSFVKWAVKKSGIFWIHPFDLDVNHPQIKNPLLNIKRHWGLKDARKKLDRLLSEIEWQHPSKILV